MFKQPLVWFSLCVHFLWLLLAVAFFWVGSSEEPSFVHRILRLMGLPASSDAIALAADLGRLDVVSLSLTILGAVLALAALGSYFVMRHTVIQTTHEEVVALIPDEVRKSFTVEMVNKAIRSDPVLLDMLLNAAREGSMPSKAADDIAEAMDEKNG